MKLTSGSVLTWICRIVAAIILLQSLFFKFSAAPESIYIFSTIGMEPWGRIGTGIIELIAALLIVIPATTVIGALIGLGVMAGALLFHVTILGIQVQGDHGQLFIYALLVFTCCLFLVILHRRKLMALVGH
jgi:uncharacterized membrane protein YphA (DoxX/SURF4 family)